MDEARAATSEARPRFATLAPGLGAVAQSGSAPRSHRGGQGFKSPQLHPSLCRSKELKTNLAPPSSPSMSDFGSKMGADHGGNRPVVCQKSVHYGHDRVCVKPGSFTQ